MGKKMAWRKRKLKRRDKKSDVKKAPMIGRLCRYAYGGGKIK